MRHPDDPEVKADSKAAAAFCLAVLGAATGAVVGGLIPATIALVLARQADVDVQAGQGWLNGERYLLWARRLAWAGIASAVAAVVILVVVRLLQDSGLSPRDYPPTVD